jgi:hypothetical protein
VLYQEVRQEMGTMQPSGVQEGSRPHLKRDSSEMECLFWKKTELRSALAWWILVLGLGGNV